MCILFLLLTVFVGLPLADAQAPSPSPSAALATSQSATASPAISATLMEAPEYIERVQVGWMRLAIGWTFTGIVIATALLAFISLMFNRVIPEPKIRARLWYTLIGEIVVAAVTVFTGLIKINPTEYQTRIDETHAALQRKATESSAQLLTVASETDNLKKEALSPQVQIGLESVAKAAREAARTAGTLRISFLVNVADEAAAKKIGSLRSDFEAAGFAWQPAKPDVKNSPDVTEIRVSGPDDRPLAMVVQQELKHKYNIDSTIDPMNHPDVGSGYVQVSLAKGALK